MKKSHSRKILIIKLGYSETLVPEVRQVCSLGDVLRTTVILHLFKGDHVTWLTDKAAFPLLQDNPYIARLMPFDLLSALGLERERFDLVINLEKVPEICSLADNIAARGRCGFGFDPASGGVRAHRGAEEALRIAGHSPRRKGISHSWSQVLYSMLGARWNGEGLILGYKPVSRETHDIGLNTHVGSLIPIKVWPDRHWKELRRLAGRRHEVSMQKHLHDLRGYMDWINSCRMIVTGDSLAIFLGLALGKRVLALFGPTSPAEHGKHRNLRVVVTPVRRECMPCFKAECAVGDVCMKYITPGMVMAEIERWKVKKG